MSTLRLLCGAHVACSCFENVSFDCRCRRAIYPDVEDFIQDYWDEDRLRLGWIGRATLVGLVLLGHFTWPSHTPFPHGWGVQQVQKQEPRVESTLEKSTSFHVVGLLVVSAVFWMFCMRTLSHFACGYLLGPKASPLFSTYPSVNPRTAETGGTPGTSKGGCKGGKLLGLTSLTLGLLTLKVGACEVLTLATSWAKAGRNWGNTWLCGRWRVPWKQLVDFSVVGLDGQPKHIPYHWALKVWRGCIQSSWETWLMFEWIIGLLFEVVGVIGSQNLGR